MTSLDPGGLAGGKPAVQSVTIWSAVAALLGLIVPPVLARLHVTPADALQASTTIGQIVTGLGALAAIYGRARATTAITSLTAPKA